MVQWLLKTILGTKNDRDIKKLRPLVDRINELEVEYQQLSDEQLQAKTPEFRERTNSAAWVSPPRCNVLIMVFSGSLYESEQSSKYPPSRAAESTRIGGDRQR